MIIKKTWICFKKNSHKKQKGETGKQEFMGGWLSDFREGELDSLGPQPGARQAELETAKGDQEAGPKDKEGLEGYQRTGLKVKAGVEDFPLCKRQLSLFLPPNKKIFYAQSA